VKKKLIGALSSIPAVIALGMSSSCATSCPFGLVNCTGQCGRFVDVNGNGLCDLSETVTTTSATSDPASTSVSDSNGSGHDGANASAATDAGDGSGGLHLGDNQYFILPISLLLIGGYLFTHLLFKKGILSRRKHHKLWNLLLTAGYVGTGGTGVLLVLMINLGIRTALNPSITYWHAELAILMVIGTLIHAHMYKKAMKNMFKVLFGLKSTPKKKKSRNVPKDVINASK
jgi:hypothetical protein